MTQSIEQNTFAAAAAATFAAVNSATATATVRTLGVASRAYQFFTLYVTRVVGLTPVWAGTSAGSCGAGGRAGGAAPTQISRPRTLVRTAAAATAAAPASTAVDAATMLLHIAMFLLMRQKGAAGIAWKKDKIESHPNH